MEGLGIILALSFILHNYEEYRSFKIFNEFYLRHLNKKFQHPDIFFRAITILSFVVCGIYVLNCFIANKALQFAATIATMSLLINGVQHCIYSLLARKLLPGTISGIFLLIPLSLAYFVLLEKDIHFSIIDIIQWSAISIVASFLLIQISLRIGFHLSKCLNDRGR